jgi:two-component system sensor histidine kinase/response regulator
LTVGAQSDDSEALRRALRDMVALSVLPALWDQFEPRQLAESLVQVLQKTLQLPLVYVRLAELPTGEVEEVATTRQLCARSEAADVGRALSSVLAAGSTDTPLSVPNPVGLGDLRCVRVPIAWPNGRWMMVAGGSEPTFPTLEERILLGAAANHAAVALKRATTFRFLRESGQRAELANREKDEFLAHVSHEIRTPMSAILGLTDLVLDSPLSGQQREWLGAVKSAGGHLLEVINSLLDFSKASADKIDLEVSEFALRDQITMIARAMADRAQKKALELVVDVDDEVPDRLSGDAGRLRQILINLLENAIKFTAAGEVVLRVSLDRAEREAEEPTLRFVVADTGIGIPAHQHLLIFEAFAQADSSTTRRYGGTGLGLTIAVKLASLMNGRISVESEPGVGSAFTLTARFRSRADADAAVDLQWPSVRVLVVTRADGTTGALVQRWLAKWQLHVDVVHDGFSATRMLMQCASGQAYRLALVDGEAPGAHGAPNGPPTRQALAEASSFRLILLGPRGGRTSESTEVRLRKPLIQDDLRLAIRRLLDPRPPEGPAGLVAERDVHSPSAFVLRVLVCEDDQVNAILIEELVRRRGHRAYVVGNGDDVLSRLAAEDFDLLFLDLHMPGLDGFQVVREIRAREQIRGGHLPVIALTALSRDRDRERCLAAGMDAFVTKPIDNAEFSASIARFFPTAVWPERPAPL